MVTQSTILKIVLISIICTVTLMSGCIENKTNLSDHAPVKQIITVDFYEKGTHFQGEIPLIDGNGYGSFIGHVNRYAPTGQHCTGTITVTQEYVNHVLVNSKTYYNLKRHENDEYYTAVLIGYEVNNIEWKTIKS